MPRVLTPTPAPMRMATTPALAASGRCEPHVTVLPLTTVERPGWLHRVAIGSGAWVITEKIRTVSAVRFRRIAPEIALTDDELADVRRVLGHMLTV